MSQTRAEVEEWQLSNAIIGDECIWRKGKRFTEEVGETVCKRYIVTDGSKVWWIPKEPELYWSQEELKSKNCILHPVEQLYQCWEAKVNLTLFSPRYLSIGPLY